MRRARIGTMVLIAVFLIGAVGPAVVRADDPPPMPTLVPPGVIAEQFYQLQQFEMVQAYDIYHTTSYTATVNGATWAIDRRFTYGEAGITILLMALVLEVVFLLMYEITLGARRQ